MARRVPAFDGLRVSERHITAHRYHPDGSIAANRRDRTDQAKGT